MSVFDEFMRLNSRNFTNSTLVRMYQDFLDIVNSGLTPEDINTKNTLYANAFMGCLKELFIETRRTNTLNEQIDLGFLNDVSVMLKTTVYPDMAVMSHLHLSSQLKAKVKSFVTSNASKLNSINTFVLIFTSILVLGQSNTTFTSKLKSYMLDLLNRTGTRWFGGDATPENTSTTNTPTANNEYKLTNGFLIQEKRLYYMGSSSMPDSIFVDKISVSDNKITYYKYPYMKPITGGLSSIGLLIGEGSKRYLQRPRPESKLYQSIKKNSEGLSSDYIQSLEKDLQMSTYVVTQKNLNLDVDNLYYDAEAFGNTSIINLLADEVRVLEIVTNQTIIESDAFTKTFISLAKYPAYDLNGNILTVDYAAEAPKLLKLFYKAHNIQSVNTQPLKVGNVTLLTDNHEVKQAVEVVNILLEKYPLEQFKTHTKDVKAILALGIQPNRLTAFPIAFKRVGLPALMSSLNTISYNLTILKQKYKFDKPVFKDLISITKVLIPYMSVADDIKLAIDKHNADNKNDRQMQLDLNALLSL